MSSAHAVQPAAVAAADDEETSSRPAARPVLAQAQPPALLSLASPFLPIRRLVSASRSRFYDPALQLDLDLTYLTDQLILTSFPASSYSLQGLYRNRASDVARFLSARHARGTWRVYNLVPAGSSQSASGSHKQQPAYYVRGGGKRGEGSYDAHATFGKHGAGGPGGGVSRYPFPDHHPPPLSLIPLMCADMTSWLRGEPTEVEGQDGKQTQRVAVIHCKAGKGRTGTMAICYLLTMKDPPGPPRDPRNYSGHAPDTTSSSANRTAQLPGREASDAGRAASFNSDADVVAQVSHRIRTALEMHTSRRLKKHSSKPTSRTGTDTDSLAGSAAESSSASLRGTPHAGASFSLLKARLLRDTRGSDSDAGSIDGGTESDNSLAGSTSVQASSAKSEDVDSIEGKQRYGVSIPSQRRWIGYWARMLALNDPRAIMQLAKEKPARRQVLVTRITVERIVQLTGTAAEKIKGLPSGGDDDSALGEGEVGATRGGDDEDKETQLAEKQAGKLQRLLPHSDSLSVHVGRYDDAVVERLEGWERAARQRFRNQGEAASSKIEGGTADATWGIDCDVEAPAARSFDLAGSGGEGTIHYFAQLRESDRRILHPDRYPATLSDRTRHSLSKKQRGLVSYSFIPSSQDERDVLTSQPPSTYALPSGRATPKAAGGLPVDADRELNIKILLGRTGGSHAALPDVAAAGWTWFIPCFEDPQGGVTPEKTAPTILRFEADEIDFCKSAMGVVAVEVEWTWAQDPPV